MEIFNDIIGYKDQKEKLLYVIDLYKNHELYESKNINRPKGVLIYGKPGTGKTSLAEATIKQCDTKVYKVVSDKMEGDLVEEINDVFNQAENDNDAIIFFDDIDKFGDKENRKVFYTIQSNIEKVKNNNVLVIATANELSELPKSLLRPGRFDISISVNNPSARDSELIIKHYLKDKNLDPNLDLNDVSKMIKYSSCAKLESILNQAALYSTYERKECIDISDIVKAYLNDEYCEDDCDFDCTAEDVLETCIHEAGHVCAAEVLKESSIGLVFVSNKVDSKPCGKTMMCDCFFNTTKFCLTTLAGKAACEMLLPNKERANGCTEDLKDCMNFLRDDFIKSGRGGFGLLQITGFRAPQVSNDTLSDLEKAIALEMERLYFITKDIISKNAEFVLKLSDALARKKYLVASDIKTIRESCKIVKFDY